MSEDMYRPIKCFSDEEPTFSVTDKVADFEGRAPEEAYASEINWEKLAEHYDIPERQLGWKEKVLNLKNPEALESEQPHLEGNWVTSYDIRAYRKGKIDIFPLAAIGVLKTKDNQIVFGVRGGEITPDRKLTIGAGLYGCPPAGSVTFHPKYEHGPIKDTLVAEFSEEIGNFDITDQRLIGVFEAYPPGPKGIKFVASLETDATLEQIQQENAEANQLRQRLLDNGASAADAANALREKGLPADAWEHSVLLGVRNDIQSIETLVRSQPQSFAGIGAGALMTYIQYQRNLYK